MLDNCILSEVNAATMRLAATERPVSYPLTTGRVLSALIRLDVANDWQRIWLHTGDPMFFGLADAPDEPLSLGAVGLEPVGRKPERWESVPLSDSLAKALSLLSRICDAYRLVPAPSGALALALLADPSNGATRVLLRSGAVTHAKLFELVQSELLGTMLEGVGDLIAGHQPDGYLVDSAANAAPGGSGVAANTAAVAASGVGRRPGAGKRLLRWRALSGAALVLTFIALFWHRQFLPPPTPVVLPPYSVPAVAHQVLNTADLPLPPAGAGGWLPMQDGPPTSGLYTGTGRWRADMRRIMFVGAWQRRWATADGQSTFQVTAFEPRSRAIALSYLASQCQPQKDAPLPGTRVAGYVVRERDGAEACAAALRGRTILAVTATSNGPTASTVAWRTVETGMRRELPRVPATATDLPPVSIASSDTRIAILSTLMGMVLGVPVLLGLITMARDRSSWRRLRSRLRAAGSKLSLSRRLRFRGSFSVDSLVSVRLARNTALVLVRIVVIVWTMRATEAQGIGTWQTGAALAAAIAGILAVEWIVRRRNPGPWRPAIFGGSRWVIGAVSLIFSVAIAGAGILLAVAGAMFSSLDVNPAGADFVTGQLGQALRVFGVILILAALLPFTLARRLGMRALRNQAKKQRSSDEERHPVLLLRSFADDRRLLRARRFDRGSIVERLCMRRFERFEEVAASALAVYGPVLALSPLEEKLPPPLGAERRSFSMDDWKDRIRELIASARLICVTVGRSESLLWEIGEIRAAGRLDRAIFLLPPTSQGEQRRRLVVLAHAMGTDFALLDQTGPEQDVLAVVFPGGAAPASTDPIVIAGRAADDVGYEAALGAWALAVTGEMRDFPADLRRLSAMFAVYAISGTRKAVQAEAASLSRLPAPKLYIYKWGKAPVYKPWTRRMLGWRLLPWTLTIFILPAIMKLAFGGALPTSSIQAKYRVTTLAQDEGSPAVYAVLEGHLIQQIDFDHPDSHWATPVKDFMTALVVDGRSAYYTSRYFGHVGRVDLRTKRTLWIHSVAAGVQSPVLIASRVVVTSPVTGTVEELSGTDGHVVARRTLSGTPYGVAASGGRLYVTLARTNQVAVLDAKTLAILATVKVPNGPRDIFTQGSRVWVLCTLAHKLILLGTHPVGSAPVRALWLSVQNPNISSAAGWLSIEGQEWVTVLSPNGQLSRIPLALPGISSMVAQSDGSVVVGYESGDIDQLGPVKS